MELQRKQLQRKQNTCNCNAMERNGKHWNTLERKQTVKSQIGWITSERKGTQRGVPSSTLHFKQPGSSHSPLRKDPGSTSQVAGELRYGFVSGLSCLPLREATMPPATYHVAPSWTYDDFANEAATSAVATGILPPVTGPPDHMGIVTARYNEYYAAQQSLLEHCSTRPVAPDALATRLATRLPVYASEYFAAQQRLLARHAGTTAALASNVATAFLAATDAADDAAAAAAAAANAANAAAAAANAADAPPDAEFVPQLPIYLNIGHRDTDYDDRIEADDSTESSTWRSRSESSDCRSIDSDPFV